MVSSSLSRAMSRSSLVLAGACLVSACGGSDGSSPTPSPSNRAPTLSVDRNAATIAENLTGTLFTLQADDPDGDTLTYSLSGEDAQHFAVDANGQIGFRNAPNYDLFADANHDNSYVLSAHVSDGRGGSRSVELTVEVRNDKEAVSTTLAANFDDPGVLVVPVNRRDELLVVKSDGSLIQFDIGGSTQTLLGNIFLTGETGRVLSAIQDRAWIFVMITIEGRGTFVRFFHATDANASRPTPMLADGVDRNATGILLLANGFVSAALGDPTGSSAQNASSGFGKLFRLNFDPYCGASLLSVCLQSEVVGEGIHDPGGAGSYRGLAFLLDRGTIHQDELTYFDPEARPLDFGWPAREGVYERSANPPADVNGPFLTFERGSGYGRSTGLVGGAVYTGVNTSLKDKLVFAEASGKILAAPASFMTDGALHTGFEVEDRSADFTPASGTMGVPKSVLTAHDGTMFILNAAGDLYRVE
ncbi:cadherin repeat domain-containing protein [Altererythrobacter sp. C41]|uniref:cadherin repeat domain-containing protein n=1 Tax=Altererythrobacter sp. C41 TaxID=2806021 RepID=UPI001931DF84|nr:cadherin repeat domain-containing protein [Altererythrobacter sp. C41]MBM0170697.1 cadherin repeat domain-containing protein [Altererythrobacter sp. C41]